MEQTQYDNEKFSTGKADIVTRVICTLFCIGVLVSTAITLSTINKVEDDAIERDFEFKNAASYRGAAGWLTAVSSTAIAYHILMIVIRILYLTSVFKKHFSFYVYITATFCILFTLSLFAGGTASAVFAVDNGKLWTDSCLFRRSESYCRNLQKVVDSEAATAVLSFLSMIIFGLLFLVMVGGRLAKVYKSNSSPGQSSFTSMDVPSYSSQVNALVQPSTVPPSYHDSISPPSYESALTMPYAPIDVPPYEPEAENTGNEVENTGNEVENTGNEVENTGNEVENTGNEAENAQ